jgi:VIT1/CCC1 family predicted Fe2+/Mn2+ transporter
VRNFIHRNLDPSSRLGEILFGLIMALGFTGSVRLGLDEADNEALFVGILGCNVAWAIVDAAMYLLTEMFERGRTNRLVRDVQAARSEEEALGFVADEVAARLPIVQGAPGAEAFHAWLLGLVRGREPGAAGVEKEDVYGAVAVALVIVLATLPIVVPFLLVADPNVAVRVSNAVALSMLFLLGAWWGRIVGVNPWRVGAGLTGIGIALVLVTIALGG